MNDPWNKCDVCGKFISMADFAYDVAGRRLVTPDSDRSSEEWETLCGEHNDSKKRNYG